SSSTMPLASPARSSPGVRTTVSMPAQPCGPQPCRPGKADISTWGRSGHFYFVLTPGYQTLTPPPRAAPFRSSRSRRSSPEPQIRHDVPVKVVGEAGARARAEIHAEVEPLRAQCVVDRRERAAERLGEVP